MAKNREIVAMRRDDGSWAISDFTADGCSDIMTIHVNGDWWEGVVPPEQIVAAFCMMLYGKHTESFLDTLSDEDRADILDRVDPDSQDAFARLVADAHRNENETYQLTKRR